MNEENNNAEGSNSNNTDSEKNNNENKEDKTANNKGGLNAETIGAETINVTNNFAKDHSKEFNFFTRTKTPDLTGDYIFQHGISRFDFPEINEFAKKLERSRLLLIACDDYMLGNEAVLSLSGQLPNKDAISFRSFNRINTREFRNGNNELNDPEKGNLFFSVETLIESCQLVEKNTLIVTDLVSEATLETNSDFLAVFTSSNARSSYFSKISDHLTTRNQYWIILIPTKIFGSEWKEYNHASLWQPKILSALIKTYCENESVKEGILKEQIDNKQWGKRPIEEIHGRMKKGDFEKLYVKYSRIQEKEKQDSTFIDLTSENPCQNLYKTIFFVLCHFPKLPPTFFNDILEVLLLDELIELPEQKSNSPDSTLKSNEAIENEEILQKDSDPISIEIIEEGRTIKFNSGKKSTEPEITKQNSKENEDPVSQTYSSLSNKTEESWSYWNSNKGLLCKVCYLTISESPFGDDEVFMIFSEPNYYHEAENALRQSNPTYFDDYFYIIFRSHLLLHSSNYVADAVLNLLRIKMIQEPRSFHAEWLTGWVISIIFETEGETSKKITDINAYWSRLQSLSRWDTYLYRWTRLLIMLLDEQKLQHIVNDFMNQLINSPASGILVMQFIRRLRNYSGFDPVRWIKQLLGRTNEQDFINETTSFLYVYVRENIRFNPELMDELVEWQPVPEKHRDNLSYIHLAALKIPFFMCINSINDKLIQSSFLPEQVFPILENTQKIEFTSYSDDTFDLITNTCQTVTSVNLLPLLDTLSKTLFKDIWVEQPNTKKAIPLFGYLLDDLFSYDNEYESVFTLLLLSWHCILWKKNRTEKENQAGTKCIEKICEKVCRRIEPESIKYIRNYLKIIRERGRKAKQILTDKTKKQQVIDLNLSSKELRNLLYRLQKIN